MMTIEQNVTKPVAGVKKGLATKQHIVHAACDTPTKAATESLVLRVEKASDMREKTLAAFLDTYALYEQLFQGLKEEAFFTRADPLRHPLIFYYGHTAAFYMNKLVLNKSIGFEERIDPALESIVSIGVDEMSWDDLLPDDYEWPSLERTIDFRGKVKDLISDLITSRLPLQDNSIIDGDHCFWPIMMGMEHERIHLETSAVLVRQLPLSVMNIENIHPVFHRIAPSHDHGFFPISADGDHSQNIEMITVPKGNVILGRGAPFTAASGAFYGWDNEYGRSTIREKGDRPSFQAAATLISNAQYLEFMQSGGYEDARWWSEEGWKWVNCFGIRHPRFWRRHVASGGWTLRLLYEDMSQGMPWDWPVEVNALEATAYARWYSDRYAMPGVRLPTETEYGRMLVHDGVIHPTDGPKDTDVIVPAHANIALQHYATSSPVTRTEASSSGFQDLRGNVWQHLRTPMYPYSGFQVHPIYDDFTVPCFDDKHSLLAGGSWASCGNEVQPWSRYAFRRHFYQFAGIRLVQPGLDDADNVIDVAMDYDSCNAISVECGGHNEDGNPYETDMQVNQYCAFHYPDTSLIRALPCPDFPVVVARLAEALRYSPKFIEAFPGIDATTSGTKLRVLDLGCAVGRTSLELARTFDTVVGVDFSARFVQVAHQLVQHESVRYHSCLEGAIRMSHVATLGTPGLTFTAQLNETDLAGKLFGSSAIEAVSERNALMDENGIFQPDRLRERVTFLQGDACNLKQLPVLQDFHLIVAANLIDRLYDPAAFLATIHTRLLPGGFLLLLSPYTWLHEFTPEDHWIGGRRIDGENHFTKQGLVEALSPTFRLVSLDVSPGFIDPLPPHPILKAAEIGTNAVQDETCITSFHVPMVIQETYRKYQHTFSQCTLWQRRA